MSPTILHLNLTRPSVDICMRIVGSGLVIIAYFIVLHVDVMLGVVTHFIADLISSPSAGDLILTLGNRLNAFAGIKKIIVIVQSQN